MLIEAETTYATVIESDVYAIRQKYDAWGTLPFEEKEFCLLQALDYIESYYEGLWKGQVVDITQPLSFPRLYIEDQEGRSLANIIPFVLKTAQIELAFLVYQGQALYENLQAGEGQIKKDVVAELQQEFFPNTTRSQPRFIYVERLLRPLTRYSRDQINLYR